MALFGWLLQPRFWNAACVPVQLVPLLSTFGLAVLITICCSKLLARIPCRLAPNIGDLAFDRPEPLGRVAAGQLALLISSIAVGPSRGPSISSSSDSSVGRAIRATTEMPDAAELVGINSRQVYASQPR